MRPDDGYTTERYSLLSGLNQIEGWLGVILLSIIVGAIVLRWARSVRTADIRPALIAAWGLSATLLTIFVMIFPELHDDEPIWHGLALNLSTYLSGDAQEAVGLRTGREGYTWIAGVTYLLLGPTPMLLIVFNFGAQGAWLVAIARITELLGREVGLIPQRLTRAVRLSAWLFCLTPGIFLWVPQILRETLAGLLVGLAVLGACNFVIERSFRHLVLAVAATVVLYWIRATMGIGLAAGLVLAVLVAWRFHGSLGGVRRIAALGATAVLGVLLSAYLDVLDRLGPEARAADMAYLSRSANSAYAGSNVYLDTPYSAILTINLPRTLLGPLPWEISLTPVMLLSVLEAVTWWAALIGTVVWVWRYRKSRFDGLVVSTLPQTATICLIVAASLIAVFALGVGNYGMLARLRPLAYACLLPLLAVALLRPDSSSTRSQKWTVDAAT